MPDSAAAASPASWEPIESLVPWDRNPRRNAAAVEKVAASIRRFGFSSPIIARKADRVIIAGHTRLLASQKLKLDKVLVRFLDLDPAEAAALALADNKLGEIAEWDDDALADILKQLQEEDVQIDDLGWEDDALADLLTADPAPLTLPADIPRHQTALGRVGLSTPFQVLLRLGYIHPERTFLDYGCGRGGDVKAARLIGVAASGYDPHYLPVPPEAADVVQLSFVLNVIEDPAERRQTLQTAYGLAGEVLAVGLISHASGTAAGDGVLTSRGTFQKVYTTDEAAALFRSACPGAPFIHVAAGIFLLFASADARRSGEARIERDRRPLERTK
jgi:hypothetical protein